ncbi:hypothetical protein D3C76_958380 [compost metagenome]
MRRSKIRSSRCARPEGFSSWRSSLEHIIGDRVRATMPEMITAPARVRANSRNSAPVRPSRKPMGA